MFPLQLPGVSFMRPEELDRGTCLTGDQLGSFTYLSGDVVPVPGLEQRGSTLDPHQRARQTQWQRWNTPTTG